MTRDKMAHDGATGSEETQRLCEAMCLLETPEEARAFLADLLSPHEMCDLAQRLEVATLLRSGRCLRGERGGYRLVLERLDGAAGGTGRPGVEKDGLSETRGDRASDASHCDNS